MLFTDPTRAIASLQPGTKARVRVSLALRSTMPFASFSSSPKFFSCLEARRSFGCVNRTNLPSPAALPTPFLSLAGGQRVVVCSAGVKKRKRYRKPYPGEMNGIVEEMRFVAMKLRNEEEKTKGEVEEEEADASNVSSETWEPTIEGYLKYLVDSKLVFDTLDKIVDEATHVAYADFRNTGLERAEALSRDIDWFRQQGHLIPEPSSPGVSYAKYLHEISETSPPGFLCHFYNIYFAHFSGGQVIGKQVAEKILDHREMDFFRWEGDVSELLKDVREKLNKLGEHWSRDEKNKCLREASKSFKLSGQIIRLIVL